MLKELRNLKQCGQGVVTAKQNVDIAMAPYDIKISLLRNIMGKLQMEIKTDPTIQQAADDLAALETMYMDAESTAKEAVILHWEEHGFSTGKKSIVMGGCQLRIRETTSRQVVDPGVVVQAAIDDGVGDKVVRELRPVFNKKAFNAWVDLKSPPGVKVTHAVTAAVIVLGER